MTDVVKCKTCNGRGRVVTTKGKGEWQWKDEKICRQCDGRGEHKDGYVPMWFPDDDDYS